MKVEIDLDVAVEDNITLQSLISSHRAMVEYLEDYKIPDHKLIAIFDTDPETDIRALKKMRDALALVINSWYGGKIDVIHSWYGGKVDETDEENK
jgi:hypothetical protein